MEVFSQRGTEASYKINKRVQTAAGKMDSRRGLQVHKHGNPTRGEGRRPGHEILKNKRKAVRCMAKRYILYSRNQIVCTNSVIFHCLRAALSSSIGSRSWGRSSKVSRSRFASNGGNTEAGSYQKSVLPGKMAGS